MKRRFNKTQGICIATALLFLISAALASFLFLEIKKKNEHISVLSNELEIEASKESRYIAIRSGIEDAKLNLEILDSYFVSPEGEVDFIERLEREARESGADARIASVIVGPLGEEKGLEVLILDLAVSGSWTTIHNFLGRVENLPYGISIDQILLQRGENDWQASLTIRVLKEKS